MDVPVLLATLLALFVASRAVKYIKDKEARIHIGS